MPLVELIGSFQKYVKNALPASDGIEWIDGGTAVSVSIAHRTKMARSVGLRQRAPRLEEVAC